MQQKRIRTIIVDDSALFRTAISRGLRARADIEVIATAANAADAEEKICRLNPDVVTLDVEMPGMNGLDFLKLLMPKHPVRVVVVSAANGIVFEAIRAGAVDFVAKPEAGDTLAFIDSLAEQIVAASEARIPEPAAVKNPKAREGAGASQSLTRRITAAWNPRSLVAIGASTGGTEAISAVLKALPGNMPGIVITQHMPPVFTRMYAERLDKECAMSVQEARGGEQIAPGMAFVAPGDRQMRVIKQGDKYWIKLGETDKVSGHCPSVDVLFESAGTAAGNAGVGILLTGMGADGAKGMLKMKEAGAFTIGQDQRSCVVYGMPMEAMKLGAVTRQASLDMVPSVLLNQLKMQSKA
ncbi:MAG: chemotaxis response regulator protein-glutamate methylesterase [Eubacteriales bacterium]|nr:chemotaxis response regulator protein-glutamate methylesterase [Eubacteriales bacterium]